ncbi:MAG: J domain-containing protein [Spirochaetales bacterium]|nr:J domain-containing protein [Spirochaetales bacterium]
MDPIFDRFGRLMRSFFTDEDSLDDDSSFSDTDFTSAWDELEDFLQSDRFKESGPSASGSSSSGESGFGPTSGGQKKPAVPEYLRCDYETLEVAFGAGLTEVKKAYKMKILKYHPDRYASNPEGQHAATRKAALINEAFQRIEGHFETLKKE